MKTEKLLQPLNRNRVKDKAFQRISLAGISEGDILETCNGKRQSLIIKVGETELESVRLNETQTSVFKMVYRLIDGRLINVQRNDYEVGSEKAKPYLGRLEGIYLL